MMGKTNRETVLLVAVALFGLAGMAFLQFGRKTRSSRAESSIVQTQTTATTDAQTTAKYQSVKGQILNIKEKSNRPEAGKPFAFMLEMSVKGPEYELDFGDGSPRLKVENGRVSHVFPPTQKKYRVVLYAKYDGEEVALDTLYQTLNTAVTKSKRADVVDY